MPNKRGRNSLLLLLSISVVFNIALISPFVFKFDKVFSERQLMSFCMKHGILDKDCKIPYQYKRK